jgi:hypothetical protein
METNLTIFSNSEYSYLWPVIEDSIKSLHELKPIFISNSTDIKKPYGFVKYIEYDVNECYAQRWLKILPQLESKYIIVVHDVNIILNCEIDKIFQLIKLIDINNIDRCSLNIFANNDYIYNDTNLQICDLNCRNTQTKTLIPFDNCPSIWKKDSYYNLWLHFPNESYRNCELNNELQNYCKNNFKCFGLNYTNEKIYRCIGRYYHNLFKILHITIKGKLTFPIEVYMDMKEDLIQILEKYSLLEKIEIDNSYGRLLM